MLYRVRQAISLLGTQSQWMEKSKEKVEEDRKKRIRRQVQKAVNEELLEMETQRITSDVKKCMGCKFWLYYENEKRERCSIKGCWDNCKYVPYTVEGKK